MSLDRIPFTTADEAMIRSLAGWMTFMAVFHIIGGTLGLGVGGCLALGGAAATMRSALAGGIILVVMVLVLAMCAAILGQGILLLGARASFHSMATTDDADQDHLSAGFRKLKTFFLLEVILGGLALLSAGLGVVSLVLGGRGGAP